MLALRNLFLVVVTRICDRNFLCHFWPPLPLIPNIASPRRIYRNHTRSTPLMERQGRPCDTQSDALTAIRVGPASGGEQRTLCHQTCSAGRACNANRAVICRAWVAPARREADHKGRNLEKGRLPLGRPPGG